MTFLNGLGRDLTEIAGALIGVAIIGLLVTNASGTAKVVESVSSGFSGVLNTATFQGNKFGNVFNAL